MYQKQAYEYSELLNYSVIPYFTTNLACLDDHWGANLPQNRTTIAIKDKIAHQKF